MCKINKTFESHRDLVRLKNYKIFQLQCDLAQRHRKHKVKLNLISADPSCKASATTFLIWSSAKSSFSQLAKLSAISSDELEQNACCLLPRQVLLQAGEVVLIDVFEI